MQKMKSTFIGNNLDFYGFFASSLCALHCAAVPLLIMFGALGSLAWLANYWIELSFIIISMVLAYWSLSISYKRHHRNRRAIKIMIAGFGLLIISRLVPHLIGDFLVVIGGLIIAYAHLVNWRLLQNCTHCKSKTSKTVLQKSKNGRICQLNYFNRSFC